MRTLHQALMGVTLIVALVVTLGVIQPWTPTALAQHGGMQHGDAASMEEHFHQFAAQLELSEEQMHAIAAPFQEGMVAMENLHRLHGMIAAELTEEQQSKFAEMVHTMLGSAFAEQAHGH